MYVIDYINKKNVANAADAAGKYLKFYFYTYILWGNLDTFCEYNVNNY